MSVYTTYRDWADGVMRDGAIRAPAAILLPAILPALVLAGLGVRQSVVWIAFLGWAIVSVSWGVWRYARILKHEMSLIDRKYDEETRYRLSKEYHSTEGDGAPSSDEEA